MKQAFIVRPFESKKTRKDVTIDFEQVHQQLIAEALNRLEDYVYGTTGVVLEAGNIRDDMFQLLLTADLVIADVSIDNANVYYELGVRHGLRNKRTVMIRCKEGDDVPFDLKTDRYLSYDKDNLAASVDKLAAMLKATINSDRVDSPVFEHLPELQEQDRKRFIPPPPEFKAEVELAQRNGVSGDLEMLAEEARGFSWEREGLRLVSRALFKLKSYEAARHRWEALRKFDPDDLEASQKLATIYQRLGELNESDLMVERALNSPKASNSDRAEAQALRGSNAKTRWRAQWELMPLAEQRPVALRSGLLPQALQPYDAAFAEDLNHYYAGINALAMHVIQLKLAEAMPEVWEEGFETSEEAKRELETLQKKMDKLAGAVELSIQATLKRGPDLWAEFSEAVRILLTSNRPPRVASAYRQALSRADDFTVDAERRQLQLYQQLGILEENVKSALSVFPPAVVKAEQKRVILFAGHMLDAPGRVPPRFPPEKEELARQAIHDAILAEQKDAGGIAYGVAGGSHGGDLLFHEVCAKLGIDTKLWLALPPDQYVKTAVQTFIGSGTDKLVERFRQLQRQRPPRWMADELELPRWLQTKPAYDFWQRHTLWMVYNALTVGTENLTLIVLWNGETGNGTADFVRRVRERGGKVVPISTRPLFGL